MQKNMLERVQRNPKEQDKKCGKRMKVSIAMALALYMIVTLAGCGIISIERNDGNGNQNASVQAPASDAGNGSSDIDDTTEVVVPAANAVETLSRELEESRASEQDYDSMTVSEQVAQYIMEQVEFELIEERQDGALVRITYPDAASLLTQYLEQYPNDPDKAKELLRDALRGKEADRVVLETEAMYADAQTKEIVWTEEIVDAMSGGLYHLTVNR